MARLIKFTCQNCGAKLAVPVSMAGESDQCPRCAYLVTAPAAPPPKVKKTPSDWQKSPELPLEESWTPEELRDTLCPDTNSAPQTTDSSPQPAPEEPALPPSSPVADFPPAPPLDASATDPISATEHPSSVPDEQEAHDSTRSSMGTAPRTEPPRALKLPPSRLAEILAAPDRERAPVVRQPPVSASEESSPSDPSDLEAPAAQGSTDAPPVELFPSASPVGASDPVEPQAQPAPPRQAFVPTPPLEDGTTLPHAPHQELDVGRRPRPSSERLLSSLLQEPPAQHKESSSRETPLRPFPPNALLPDSHTRPPDEEAVQAASVPGMGEVLASAHPDGGEERPWQHIPLVPVSISTAAAKRKRKQRLIIMGVVAFLVADAAVVIMWCRKDLVRWWHGAPPEPTLVIPQPKQTETALPEASTGPLEANPLLPPPAAGTDTKGSETPIAPPTAANPTVSQPRLDTPPATVASPEDLPVPAAIPLPAPNASASAKLTTDQTLPFPSASDHPEASPGSPAGMKAQTGEPSEGIIIPLPTSPPVPPPLPGDPTPSEMHGETEKPTPAQPELPTVGKPQVIGQTPAKALAAQDALIKFLEAPNWASRAAFTNDGPAMQARLQRMAPPATDGPIPAGTVRFLDHFEKTKDSNAYTRFEMNEGKLIHPVWAMLEHDGKGGAKIDGETFVEFYHDLLLRFLEKKGSPKDRFRVILRRKHYFAGDVPARNTKDSFEIKQPNANYQGHVFTPKTSAVAKQLNTQLPWDSDILAIVELAWMNDGKHQWIEIASIPSFGWKG